MQGVILSFDPKTNTGLIITDTPDRTVYQISPDALSSSLFTTLRQGQRINFDILETTDDEADENSDVKLATNVRLGSEVDMGISTARV